MVVLFLPAHIQTLLSLSALPDLTPPSFCFLFSALPLILFSLFLLLQYVSYSAPISSFSSSSSFLSTSLPVARHPCLTTQLSSLPSLSAIHHRLPHPTALPPPVGIITLCVCACVFVWVRLSRSIWVPCSELLLSNHRRANTQCVHTHTHTFSVWYANIYFFHLWDFISPTWSQPAVFVSLAEWM